MPMKVSLNLKPCEIKAEIQTLGELMAFIENECLSPGEVLIRIVIDGDELREEEEQAHQQKSIEGLQIVEFYSARTIDLAEEGLTDATQLLPSLAEDLPVVSAELRAGNIRDGLEMFAKCIEIVSWYVSLVTAVDIIFRRADPSFRLDPAAAKTAEDLSPEADLTAITAEEGPELRTFASVENLRQKLMDIEQAQENNDTLLLADLIEYEVLPIISIWEQEVPVLLAKVKREGGSA